MRDAETKYVVELQTLLSSKLAELGFAADPLAREFVHHLAEIAARCRTLERESLPLFNALSAEHRRSFAQLIRKSSPTSTPFRTRSPTRNPPCALSSSTSPAK